MTGVLEVEAGVRLRRLAAGEPSLLVAGGLSLVLGVALVALSEADAAYGSRRRSAGSSSPTAGPWASSPSALRRLAAAERTSRR